MTHYETLGIDKTADAAAIKAAYKSAAQKHHPDKGGDEEKFKAITKAYEILSDPQKRARYDTGKDPEGATEAQREEALSALFLSVLDKFGDSIDIIEEMRAHFRKQKQTIAADITITRQLIRKREKIIGKVIRKSGENFIVVHMRRDIAQKQAMIQGCEKMLLQCDELLEDLKDYVYEKEAAMTYATYQPLGYTA